MGPHHVVLNGTSVVLLQSTGRPVKVSDVRVGEVVSVGRPAVVAHDRPVSDKSWPGTGVSGKKSGNQGSLKYSRGSFRRALKCARGAFGRAGSIFNRNAHEGEGDGEHHYVQSKCKKAVRVIPSRKIGRSLQEEPRAKAGGQKRYCFSCPRASSRKLNEQN